MVILYLSHCMKADIFDKIKQIHAGRIDALEYRVDERAKRIARKLRKIRELKGLTREKFCEPLG